MTTTSELLVFDKELLEERQWWVGKLSQQVGKPGLVPDFDTDGPPAAEHCVTGIELSRDLYKKLLRTANNSPFLLYAVLMAGLKACLYRFTGGKRIVVGSPALKALNRANALAIADELDGGLSFKQLLLNVRQSLLEAYARQNYPYHRLVEDLGLRDQDFGTRLFEITLSLGSIHGELPPTGCSIRIFFDGDRTEGLSGLVEYDRSLFKRETVELFMKCYRNLLGHAADSVEKPIHEMPILDDAERDKILLTWNSTESGLPAEACVHRRFEEHASRNPDAVAAVYEDYHLSYRRLNERANQVSRYLRRQGVGPEAVVGILMEPSLEMIIGIIGILKAGGAFLPLDASYPKERLLFMLDNSQASILLTSEQLAGRAANSTARVIALDAEWGNISAESNENYLSPQSGDNLAYLIYTSGSTGLPKAVLLHHRGACNLAEAQSKVFGLGSGHRVLQFASLSFDASVWEILMALLGGGTLFLGSKESLMPGPALVELLRSHAITHITLPPSVLSALPKDELGLLSTVIVAGEACSAQMVRDWSGGRRFFNAYGPTETTVCATVCECRDTGRTPSIGRPISNFQVYILDDHLQPVPVGVVGEMYIGGVGLARGYLREFGQTAQKFVADPFASRPGSRLFKTGDLARFRSDGQIEFVGRVDHQVKIHGLRIELGEIEAALRKDAGVREAVVMVREDPPGGKRLVAYVVPHAQSRLTADELRSYLRGRLPEFMLPSAFVLLESFPLTSAGKVDRKALPAPATGEAGGKYTPPRDAIELRLVQIWEDLLGAQPIGVNNDFFELGGNSILVAVLIVKIQRAFGVRIPVALLFQNPTVEKLGVILRRHAQSLPQSPLVAIQPKGARRPFFCVHPAGGNVTCYVSLARELGTDQPFYALQDRGLDPEASLHNSIEGMAAEYVEVLRGLQPEGPYLLGGWSMGGIVAYEMGVQLRRAGQDVGLLALFDTPAPAAASGAESEDEMDDAALLVDILGNVLGEAPQLSVDYLRRLSPDEQMLCVIDLARKANRAIPDLDLAQAHRLLHVFKNNSGITRAYRPQPYPGRITLFRAGETGDDHMHGPALGWDHWAMSGVDIPSVPGTHQTMIFSPHVQRLAERLSASLDEAQTRSGRHLINSIPHLKQMPTS